MPNFTFFLLIAAFIPELAKAATTAATADEITDPLPGINFKPNFKHYSGYLQVSPTRFLFYWFVTSQGNPNTDPIIFWFNGGPGCSSVGIGLLKEIGPYLINRDGKTLRQNPFAWNKNASIVFIESPAGTGFSYASDGNHTTNDQLTATQNYQAIKEFFTKYSEFSNNSVYIAGQSYAGIYVPMLAEKIREEKSLYPVNLKGIILGNPVLNASTDYNSAVMFAYGHALITYPEWNKFRNDCCNGCIDFCDFSQLTGNCLETADNFIMTMWTNGLNPYNLYQSCNTKPLFNSLSYKAMVRGILPKRLSDKILASDMEEQSSNYSFIKAVLPVLNALQLQPPCLDDKDVTKYLNQPKVQKALNIQRKIKWDVCNDALNQNYVKQLTNTTGLISNLLNANLTMLFYYGVEDMAANFIGGMRFAWNVTPELDVINEIVPWKVDNRVAGVKTVYGNNATRQLTFTTVLGAGHQVPMVKANVID